ncbi:MAG: sigma-70 family RNA polymerase sigma factor [Bacteroidales bacterium]|nr:sigma-70 family RNA polymerase sigma factor [Bacteroidales bacterium]
MSEKVLISTFTAMRRKFLRMAMHILPNEDDAADALQDAFCRLWPRRERIESNAEAEALTATTLKNICIDNLRKKKITTTQIDEEHDRPDEEEQTQSIEEQYNRVKAIIDSRLTPQQKEIIELKDYHDLTIEEIAARMGTSETAVRMHLSRGRKKIRECYRKEVQDER